MSARKLLKIFMKWDNNHRITMNILPKKIGFMGISGFRRIFYLNTILAQERASAADSRPTATP